MTGAAEGDGFYPFQPRWSLICNGLWRIGPMELHHHEPMMASPLPSVHDTGVAHRFLMGIAIVGTACFSVRRFISVAFYFESLSFFSTFATANVSAGQRT